MTDQKPDNRIAHYLVAGMMFKAPPGVKAGCGLNIYYRQGLWRRRKQPLRATYDFLAVTCKRCRKPRS